MSKDNEQPPSPSPPPQPPIAATPGPRAAAFIDLYNKALSNTLKAVSYDSFAACFPLIAKQAPEALKGMHSGLVAGLEGFGKDEFATILQERNVIENLNRLEDLIADAKRRKARAGESGSEDVIPPHTLPPAPLLSAALAPLYISQQSQLNAKLQTTQSQNATLVEGIRIQREEIERLLALGEGLVRDLEGAGDEMAKNGDHGDVLREAEKAVGEFDSV